MLYVEAQTLIFCAAALFRLPAAARLPDFCSIQIIIAGGIIKMALSKESNWQTLAKGIWADYERSA